MEIDRSSTAASWRVMYIYIYILSARLAYMLINMQLHWCFCYTVGGMFVESELVRWCNQSRLNSKLCCNKSKMTDHVFGDVFALRPAITTNLLQKTATVLEKRLVFPPVGWLSAAYDATWLLMYFARASCLTSRAQNVGSPVKSCQDSKDGTGKSTSMRVSGKWCPRATHDGLSQMIYVGSTYPPPRNSGKWRFFGNP